MQQADWDLQLDPSALGKTSLAGCSRMGFVHHPPVPMKQPSEPLAGSLLYCVWRIPAIFLIGHSHQYNDWSPVSAQRTA